jgi:hypothetical protein
LVISTPQQVVASLPPRPEDPFKHQEFNVRYRSKNAAGRHELWCSLNRHQAVHLAKKGLVYAEIYKHEFFRLILAHETTREAQAALNELSEVSRQYRDYVSKKRQGRGSKYWVERPDRAQGGLHGRRITVFRPMAVSA